MAFLSVAGLEQPKIPSLYPSKIPIKAHPSFPSLDAFPIQRRSFRRWVKLKMSIKASSGGGSTPGLYSAKQFELTAKNVDLVLEDVRPYLIADGGNVDVVSVEDGIISLKLQGACGSCPSSTTTMKMGIEQVLKEKFGDAVKDIQQVYDEQIAETTVEMTVHESPATSVSIKIDFNHRDKLIKNGV
ncbi:NifU-like protein 1, chloroplastic [Ancistrocladus abbreviatus]